MTNACRRNATSHTRPPVSQQRRHRDGRYRRATGRGVLVPTSVLPAAACWFGAGAKASPRPHRAAVASHALHTIASGRLAARRPLGCASVRPMHSAGHAAPADALAPAPAAPADPPPCLLQASARLISTDKDAGVFWLSEGQADVMAREFDAGASPLFLNGTASLVVQSFQKFERLQVRLRSCMHAVRTAQCARPVRYLAVASDGCGVHGTAERRQRCRRRSRAPPARG